MTPDSISLNLHLHFMGWSDTRGRGEGGWGDVCVHVALLGYDGEKGAGIKPFTRATLWIMSLTTLRVQGGRGDKRSVPLYIFKTIFERNI